MIIKKCNMKKVLLAVYFLISVKIYCQNEDKIWYFGPTGAGLDFTNCEPVVKTNGFCDSIAWEGSVSICDNITGRLLFYANGYNVYDSTLNVMQNGANTGLSNSVSQNVIIKKPGTNNLFFVITTDVQAAVISSGTNPNANGIYFAEIDMNLNSGKGAVTSKFNPLRPAGNCEKLTVIKNSNGVDYWLIGHEYYNDTFFVYNITNSGINLTPILQKVGPVINIQNPGTYQNSHYDAIGELKPSPNGTKIAFTTFYTGTTALFDFNNSTGLISNPVTLNINGGGYGVSFSSDNTKLYISVISNNNYYPPTNSSIVQFDINSGVQPTIQNSRQTIYTRMVGGYGSLKLAPNGRIYVARYGDQGNNAGDLYLGVINSPNNNGALCNFVHNGIYLNGLKGSWGLNNVQETNNYCMVTGLESYANPENLFTLYPNPSNGKTKLKINKSVQSNDLIIYLLNSMGITIGKINISDDFLIDLSDHKNDFYFLQFSFNGKIITKKIILNKF